MSASRLVTYRGCVVHCDLMPRDSAKLAPWFDLFPNRSSIYLQDLVYRRRPAPCRLQQNRGREDSCYLQRGQMHVKRQRRAKYGKKAKGIISKGVVCTLCARTRTPVK